MSRTKSRRFAIIAFLALGLGLFSGVTVNAGNVDPVERELGFVAELYRAITGYHVLLQGDGVTRDMVAAALYDVERYVEELDGRYATNKLFIEDHAAMEEITQTVAKAHLQAALLHAKGVDLEGSISQYEKVIDLLGYNPVDWEESIARSAVPGMLPGVSEIVFEMASPREVVEDLKRFWAAGVVTRFKVEEYGSASRQAFKIERIGGRKDPFSEAAFALASERFSERIAEGLEEFRVVLPPGRYRVSAADPTVETLEVALSRGGVPDPIVLNPNTFNFEFASPDEKCALTMTINGLTVKNFQGLSYGTYRVRSAPGCTRRIPDKITVEQNSEVSLRTEPERLDYVKEGQPIFLFITTPPGSTYTLRM